MPEAHPTTGSLVWRLAMRWRAAVDRAVTPLGLTHAQYSALASLRAMTTGGGRPSQRELASYTGLDAIYISKLVRALERNGLVARAPHPSDARAVQLALTDRGIAVIDEAVVVVRALDDELTASLGGRRGADVQALQSALRTLLGSAPEVDPENPPPSDTGGQP